MNIRSWSRAPDVGLDARIREASERLGHMRVDLAMGRLPPEQYALVAHDLERRLAVMERERLRALLRRSGATWRVES